MLRHRYLSRVTPTRVAVTTICCSADYMDSRVDRENGTAEDERDTFLPLRCTARPQRGHTSQPSVPNGDTRHSPG